MVGLNDWNRYREKQGASILIVFRFIWGVGQNTVGLQRWWETTGMVGRQRGALPEVSPRTREAVRGGNAWGECEGEDGGVCCREQRGGNYPFNPVKAMPRTKFFWNIRKTISGGIDTSTEPAMTA